MVKRLSGLGNLVVKGPVSLSVVGTSSIRRHGNQSDVT